MTRTEGLQDDVAAAAAAHLPALRRFARALCGSQAAGDAYAAATLEAILADPAAMARDLPPRTALLRVLLGIWNGSGARLEGAEDARSAAAQARLEGLAPSARAAVLLSALEELPVSGVAAALDVPEAEAEELLARGSATISGRITGEVLIIEDETIIAMDLEAIVEGLGHGVQRVARTRAEALAKLDSEKRPDLVLADISLADGSSGIDAVRDIQEAVGVTPVIFITAYPERLLTGTQPEPTFLLTKPFKEAQVRAAIDQALFFRDSGMIRL